MREKKGRTNNEGGREKYGRDGRRDSKTEKEGK